MSPTNLLEQARVLVQPAYERIIEPAWDRFLEPAWDRMGRLASLAVAFADTQRALSKIEESGGVATIRTFGSTPLIAFDAQEQEELLRPIYRFTPRVELVSSGATIWLPELALFGEGDTLEEAEWALVDAAMDYVDAWEHDLGRSPNHANRRGWVQRLRIAGNRDRVHQVLFPA